MQNYLNFATKASTRHERSRQWRAVTQALLAELEDDREASIAGCDLGELRLCRVSLGRHWIESECGTAADGGEGLLKFLLQEEGNCTLRQADRSVVLKPGQWGLIDKSRAFRIEAPAQSRQIALVVPKHRISGWEDAQCMASDPDNFLSGMGQVLHAAATSALTSAPILGDTDRTRLGEILIDLLNATWGAEHADDAQNPKSERRLEAMEYIERHLSDPELNPATIAEGLGCSKRTLHKIFADEVMSIGRLIWERRLVHCQCELADPTSRARSITDIAYSWGFNDSQHFSRSFKRRFGLSPREYRNAQRWQGDNPILAPRAD